MGTREEQQRSGERRTGRRSKWIMGQGDSNEEGSSKMEAGDAGREGGESGFKGE